jgi:phage host-nuclease inhibitor protein Gam
LSKDNKSLKEELRTNIRRVGELEEDLAVRSLEFKDCKNKIASREHELESNKSEISSLSKTVN